MSSGYSVEVQTPITMNEHFSVMSYLLAKSLAQNARFPGPWKLVLSVSGDSDLDPASPQFAWAKDYPVEFQAVDPWLWNSMGHVGTGTQCVLNRHDSDVVLFIDADVVVKGSLDDVTSRIARGNAIFGWPCWSAGDTRFGDVFRAAGIETSLDYKLTLTDEGTDTSAPDWPPYFNFGFVGASRSIANQMRETFVADQVLVEEKFKNYYSGQVALALNIARNRYPYELLDERYNVGSDHPVALEHYQRAHGRPMLPTPIANEDPRVLHYCFPTPTLQKRRDMASFEALMAFLLRPGLEGFERHLQETLRGLDLLSERDSYRRGLSRAHSLQLERELAQLREASAQTIGELRTRVQDLQRSRSWRVTAPLRRAFDLLLRLRRVGARAHPSDRRGSSRPG